MQSTYNENTARSFLARLSSGSAPHILPDISFEGPVFTSRSDIDSDLNVMV